MRAHIIPLVMIVLGVIAAIYVFATLPRYVRHTVLDEGISLAQVFKVNQTDFILGTFVMAISVSLFFLFAYPKLEKKRHA